MRQHLEAGVEPPGRLGFLKGGDQVGERTVVHAAATLGRGDRQASRKMCCADTRSSARAALDADTSECKFWRSGAARRSQSRFTLQPRLRYSARNASTGSTLSARLAGCQAAKVARASSATAAAANVIVSNGSTPCRRP